MLCSMLKLGVDYIVDTNMAMRSGLLQQTYNHFLASLSQIEGNDLTVCAGGRQSMSKLLYLVVLKLLIALDSESVLFSQPEKQ